MSALVITILKVLLIGSLVVLGVLLIAGIVLSIGWPWWAAGFVLVGLFGIGAGVTLLRKAWLQRREQRFVNQVIAQDEAYVHDLNEKDRQSQKELQARWKEAVEVLRKSHLRKYGNPLYVLPWYMLVGESGSGKTTAIQSARLSSPFAEISSTSGISGTKNCDWWFFDNGIFIDTAGRYTVPVDESRDKEEWQKFLAHLKKFRKKESLNGLAVTVAADTLLAGNPEALEATGKSIRNRIDELMLVLGTKFPIYILVTKCDLIQGMTHFCDRIDEAGTNQAMGALNPDFSKKHSDFVDETIAAIAERLKDLRLQLLQKPGAGSPAPGILMFPDEFAKVKPGLDAFVRGAFQENPYQEKPILRGLFFSSGKQEGAPYSHLLKELGLIDQQEVLPGTSKGLFLHDFFSKILPGDRGLFAPTQRSLAWGRLTRNLGFTSWLAICVFFCGMLSFSFVKNLSTIREISQEFQKPIQFKNDIMADAMTMHNFLETIIRVEKKNRRFRAPRLGLTESQRVERELKKKFCNKYREGFLGAFDNQASVYMARFSPSTPRESIGSHVSHMVRRIHLIQAKLDGRGADALFNHANPAFTPLISHAGDPIMIPDLDARLARLYLHYLLWQPNNAALQEEINHLRKWLRHVLTLHDVNLNWLADWVNADRTVSPVLMSDYWGDTRFDEDILPAFTRDGKNRIDKFVPEIEAALPDPLIIAEKKLDFQEWYNKRYFNAWHSFASVFSTGPETLASREQWAHVASRIGSEHDPFFQLLDSMAWHLAPYADAADRPAWVDFIFNFQEAKHQAAIQDKKAAQTDSTLIKRATRQVQSTIKATERATGIRSDRLLDTKDLLLTGQTLLSYRETLGKLTPAASSQRLAYHLAAEFYENDLIVEPGEAAFAHGYEQADLLKGILRDPGRDLAVMDRLIAGPITFLHEFALREVACYIQNAWERQVMLEVKGVVDQDVNQLLMGEKGPARKFIEGPAAPFIDRSIQKGYYPVVKKEKSVGFSRSFLTYLNNGERAYRTAQSTYNVVVRAEPTSANPEARTRPHQSVLQLRCEGTATQLINLNYPVSRNFAYSPRTCSDVMVTVNIGNLHLTRTYSGYLAFPRFIKDFGTGSRRFFPADFPEHQLSLQQMGIAHISMGFDFQGHGPVLDFLAVAAEPVPETIGACWD